MLFRLHYKSCGFHFIKRLLNSEALVFDKYGDPEKVLKLQSKSLTPFSNEEVLVKTCAAPINPSDINIIQGVYALKPCLPAIAGNEGVGKVLACGKNVTSFGVGDLVIPVKSIFGTWQTYWCGKEDEFIKINRPISYLHAAVISVNPSTAIHLVNNFVELHKGDTIIQNGATSAVGIYVIQIAKMLGYKTVNLFRDRDTTEATEETRKILIDYGATVALTESEFTNYDSIAECKHLGRPKLALNCLGGKPALKLLKSLDFGGTMTTYGGMTRSPMPLSIGPLLFNDVRLRGFWLTNFNNVNSIQKRCLIIDQIAKWFERGIIKPSPFIEIPFTDWIEGLALSTFKDTVPVSVRKKVILIMNQ